MERDFQEALALILDSNSSFFRPSWKSRVREKQRLVIGTHTGVSGGAKPLPSLGNHFCFVLPFFGLFFETASHIAQFSLELAPKPK